MFQRIGWAALVVALVVLTPAMAQNNDLDRLKENGGKWKVNLMEAEGKSHRPENVTATFVRELRDPGGKDLVDKFILNQPGDSPNPRQFEVSLVPSEDVTRPSALNLIAIDGPFAGKTIPGIYRLDGDVLKLCLPLPSDGDLARPIDFSTKPGSGSILLELQRSKPK